MQALTTPTVCPCYAAANYETARGIAAFLEAGSNARVFLDDGVIEPGGNLLAKVRDARAADVVLVLFSEACPLPPASRAQWEDALVKEPVAEGVRIAFLQCDDWTPPRTLQPQFDCRGLPIGVLRQLKRWVRRRVAPWIPPDQAVFTGARSEVVDALGAGLADQPGALSVASVALAYEFVHAYREDFDEVLRLECGGRSLTALAGDLGAQIGLRLEGDLQANLQHLRDFCAARRFLVLLENAAGAEADQLTFGGCCSTLRCAEAGPAVPLEPESLRALQAAFQHPGDDWREVCRLARIGRRLTREQSRIAELHELMEQWHAAALAREDREVLEESAREMVWILEGWGRTEEASRLEYRRATEFDQQMAFPFGPVSTGC